MADFVPVKKRRGDEAGTSTTTWPPPRLCRRCKQTFDPRDPRAALACVYHPEDYSGETWVPSAPVPRRAPRLASCTRLHTRSRSRSLGRSPRDTAERDPSEIRSRSARGLTRASRMGAIPASNAASDQRPTLARARERRQRARDALLLDVLRRAPLRVARVRARAAHHLRPGAARDPQDVTVRGTPTFEDSADAVVRCACVCEARVLYHAHAERPDSSASTT